MRLLIVSNRLPITVVEKKGQFHFEESMGGLVSGLSAYLDSLRGSKWTQSDYLWVGWPGLTVAEDRQAEVCERGRAEHRAVPVFLTQRAMDSFYHGFCNKTIWPLFHYFSSYAQYSPESWDDYQAVNASFCKVVLETLEPDDLVWVHDYHLMLLPQMLRASRPDLSIGFFLHIPFPSFEVFRQLPSRWRAELLRGMLGADLVGFHTADYADYFTRCVLQFLGIDAREGIVEVQGRRVHVAPFPMGIDYAKYHRAASGDLVQRASERLRKPLSGRKVILSVDRLDYSKGIVQRLDAFQLFLEMYPQWRRKVTLVMVVVPSRIGVERYAQMSRQINELVGEINGRWGTMDWTPILYQYRYLPFDDLVSLYILSDVALVTPLRDGMNLIAKEYIASRTNRRGVLVLSEMAGSAHELREALLINPNDLAQVAEALNTSLAMPEEEQVRRNAIMQERLSETDVMKWANDFIAQTRAIRNQARARPLPPSLTRASRAELIAGFSRARRRLLLLDYDGTLVPFAEFPPLARPDSELLDLLNRIGASANTELVLISGRDRETMERWLGDLPVGLVAEHGVWSRSTGSKWMVLPDLNTDWKPLLLKLFQEYAHRLPGSHVEEKDYAVVWHYRVANPELGMEYAQELVRALNALGSANQFQVLRGIQSVEVRSAGVNKGIGAWQWLGDPHPDWILAIGDDRSDEDLFRALPPEAFTLKVGFSPSAARYCLSGQEEVLDFLKLLAEISVMTE